MIFQKTNGSVLIIALLVLGVMVFLSSYFVSFSLTGSQMSRNQVQADQAYYLAEAGVQEAIFKFKNDSTWKNSFETLPTVLDPACSSWSISQFQRSGGIFDNGGYTITINNLGCAKAEIVSQSFLTTGLDKKAQRIVKVKISKAMGNPISDYGIFTGGASENGVIRLVDNLGIHSGNLLVQNVLQVRSSSKVNVDKKVLAGGNVSVDSSSQINSTSTCAKNVCDSKCDPATECPPLVVEMPPLDFDSASPSSFLSRATISDCSSLRNDGKTNCVFTVSDFEKVLWSHYPAIAFPTSSVVYVLGDVNIRAGQEITVNGVLVSNRDISLGTDNCWTSKDPPYSRCGFSVVKVLRPGSVDDNLPSGLLAKRKFITGAFLGSGSTSLFVQGLIYSSDQTTISSVQAPIEIYGGIAARKIDISSIYYPFDIYLEPDVIIDTFGNPSYSPVIIVDHWEEEY